MNAIDFLTKDHREVESLFKQINSDPDNGQVLAGQLRLALLAHTRIEEQIFYPALKKFDELRDLVAESLQEHQQVEKELEQMSSISMDSKSWQNIVDKLQRDVEHHVREEEGEMFPKVQRLIDEETLNEMGRELEITKTKEMVSL
ncbi:MAG TPA: hemerythrin domain-containing protein [Blastocatellia bacterium]|nr:hemerythrin domain-containing protein [Blastocatellia bacterium]